MKPKKSKCIKTAVVGVGLIGRERLRAIKVLQERGKDVELLGILDPFSKDIEKISSEFNTGIYKSVDELLASNPEWVLISTPHDVAMELIEKCLKAGCKVLAEKPLGRSASEAEKIVKSLKFKNCLYVGFNYRFYAGINAALNDIKRGKFGKLISLNFLLGHGGSPGMEKSWKLDPVRAGGGCLIDPGIHLLDLCLIASNNDLKIIGGGLWKGFWNTGIEEECHLLFKSKDFLINLQVSIVKWRSTFRMEVNGVNGYGVVNGRDRSYGSQTYVRGKRWGWQSSKDQKSSEEIVLETSGNNVFADEIERLWFGNVNQWPKPCTAEEALKNMELLDNCLEFINKGELNI